MTRATTGGMIRAHPARKLWEGRYVGADGKRHSIYAKTRRETQERLRTALRDADQGIRPVDQRGTFGAFLDEWLDTSVRPRLRPRTVESYSETVERYVRPAIGKIALAKLTPEDVSAMLRSLTARGDLSPTTVRYVYSITRIALGRALRLGRVHRNVATFVEPPTKATPEMHPLTAV